MKKYNPNNGHYFLRVLNTENVQGEHQDLTNQMVTCKQTKYSIISIKGSLKIIMKCV